ERGGATLPCGFVYKCHTIFARPPCRNTSFPGSVSTHKSHRRRRPSPPPVSPGPPPSNNDEQPRESSRDQSIPAREAFVLQPLVLQIQSCVSSFREFRTASVSSMQSFLLKAEG